MISCLVFPLSDSGAGPTSHSGPALPSPMVSNPVYCPNHDAHIGAHVCYAMGAIFRLGAERGKRVFAAQVTQTLGAEETPSRAPDTRGRYPWPPRSIPGCTAPQRCPGLSVRA